MWKIINLNLFALILLPVCLMAQQKITGKITDSKKRPLPGVNIAIKDTYDGASSAADGTFSFTTDLKGEQIISVTLNGYRPFEQKINLSNPQVYNIVLKEVISQLNVVTISAGSFEASDERKGTVLKPLDIVSTAGAGADIVNALKTLPGTQQTNDREGLFVRGGTGYETQTFIDGLLVRNPFYSGLPDMPGRGRFSPFLFKGTTFSSGGYSAQYGQGLSSALILESQDLPERSSSSVGLSVIGASVGVDELSKDKKGSYGVEADYTNLGPYLDVVKSKFKPSVNPEIIGTSANFRRKTSSTGMLKFYGYGNWTHMGTYHPSLEYPGYNELFELRNQNVYTNLTYKERLGRGWRISSGLSFSSNTDDIHTDTLEKTAPTKINNLSSLTQARVMLTKSIGYYSSLRMGGEYQYGVEKGAFNSYHANYTDNYSAVFAEGDIYLTPQLVGRVGGRVEHSSVLAKTNFAPRVSLAYKMDAYSQVSLAYGDYYQKPEQQYLRFKPNMDYMKATHYIASVQRITGNYTLRVEAFYKKYHNLVKTSPDTSNGGTGYAKGIELFWRDHKTFKNMDYWISYSYLDTKRNYLTYPYEVQPDFAAKHTFSVVYKYYVPSITTFFGATYSFSTGRPYYNPNLPDNQFMTQKTMDYNSLGLTVSYLTSIKKAFTVFVLSVSNIGNFKQVYGYRYSTDKLRREEITPNIPRFIYVGMFMNFGIDRRQDVINNL
ncbi:TonB-dependent receptor plug domain-containing protein [Chitinophaga oryziterrae]|uniref:TonB-dependent receptor plug domain-containing protein n=1 Tax=Chitinophaga oryziterrae TaxID=1031224 RepID=A0A6N8JH26_9BACT|nr:TonB-dependent receptor [Chitinophaga oryziterrae]MVT43659.1 TonB-dependent receptor plug domain-containing protein [Chitinophaga oryziterrae]